jgi:hypothetical protein
MRPARRLAADERGIALLTTLLVAFAISAIAIAAAMMTLNANLIGKNSERSTTLDAAALAGLEEARSRINGTANLIPLAGYTTLESNVTVKDASNAAIPKVTRTVYAGPTGITTGQYGVFASIIAVAQDSFGNRVVRRLEVNQQSFARFAYFSNQERDTVGNSIVFGGGDVLTGPVFSNDTLRISTALNPSVTFKDEVQTARIITNSGNASFTKPPQTGVKPIPMPTVADLNRLDSLATVGATSFVGYTTGGFGEATTRVEFVTFPVNGNPTGFFRVYQAANTAAGAAWASASLPAGNLRVSPNCGDFQVVAGVPKFLSALNHTTTTPAPHNHNTTSTAANEDSSLTRTGTIAGGPASRCFLGGTAYLVSPGGDSTFQPNDANGAWVQAPASIRALTGAYADIAARPDKDYLFPLDRSINSNFKGVVSVRGKVVVNGVVHGRVTVAAAGDIVIGDDIVYWDPPATRDCTTGDMVGLFSGQNVVVANNTINAPQTTNSQGSKQSGPVGTFRSYDETKDETIDGVVLTLNSFGAQDNGLGSATAESCTIGGTTVWGRGCLVIYGGIIMGRRSPVGTTGGTGYLKRYTYDACGATDPPPYFPTTGRYAKNRFYDMDPTTFNVAGWFTANQH